MQSKRSVGVEVKGMGEREGDRERGGEGQGLRDEGKVVECQTAVAGDGGVQM